MNLKNVLVYPCGTDAGLELNTALGQMIHYRLYGIGEHERDRGEHVYRNYLGNLVPGESDFLARMSQFIEQYEIDFIYPASFEALKVMTQLRESLRAEVVAPSQETVEICETKKAVAAVLQGDVFFADDDPSAGEEYTAVCFTDRHGVLKFVRTVEKKNCIIKETDLDEAGKNELKRTAQLINDRLHMQGPWTFRFTIGDKFREILLHDIVPGYAAVMDYYRNQGVNLATLSLFDRMGHNVEIREQKLSLEASEHSAKRYRMDWDYDDVYFDLDDTIIVNDKVNPIMMAFLFQCRNRGKKIHLITKHRFELSETLKKHRLQGLFDNIIWLKSSDQKSLHIKPERAIFIDDAFSERKEVSDRLGIPTFEVSAVESLIDWRL